MKTNITQLTLLAALSIVGASTAYADNHAPYWPAASTSAAYADDHAPYGHATSTAATRQVNIDSGTKYLNVTRFETVQLNVAGKSVTWTFDTLGKTPFPLSKVIPGADDVTVPTLRKIRPIREADKMVT